MIVKDYCKGFGVCITNPLNLTIVFTPGLSDKDGDTWNTELAGLHLHYSTEPSECVIYLAVPVMNDDPSRDTLLALIHEVTHYCQVITDRHQGDSEECLYSYRPSELEAHGLQEYYLNLWHSKNTK